MKQIKTIHERTPEMFDNMVNGALSLGWQLKRRYADETGYHAELEMHPHTCDDCRHHGKMLTEEPCCQCGENYCKWEPLEQYPQWEEKESFLELEAPQDDNQETD